MKKLMSISLVIVLVLGVSVFVLAHGQARRNGYNQDEYYNQLRLSEQQVHNLEELEDDYYDKVDDLRDELWDKQEDLREVYVDKDIKREEISQMHNQINKLRQELFKINQQYRLKLREMLSDKQLEEMNRYGMRGIGFYNCGRYGHSSRRRGQMYGPSMMHQGPGHNDYAPGHHGGGMMNGF
mgnify:FL=1